MAGEFDDRKTADKLAYTGMAGRFSGGAGTMEGYQGLRVAVYVKDVLLGGHVLSGTDGPKIEEKALLAIARMGVVENTIFLISNRPNVHRRQLIDSHALRDVLLNNDFSLYDVSQLNQRGFFGIHSTDDWRATCGSDKFDIILGNADWADQKADYNLSVDRYNEFIDVMAVSPDQDILEISEVLARKDRAIPEGTAHKPG